MHGALRRGLFASGLFGFVAFSLGVACSAPETEESPSAQGGRGLSLGRIFSRDGALVASIAQEGMVRVPEHID